MLCSTLASLTLALALFGISCEDGPRGAGAPSGDRSSTGAVTELRAFRETRPVPHGGDAADDPALWIDRDRPARSTIIGTDKLGGLGVYDLHGRQLQYLAGGRPNNVDVRHGFRLGGRTVALVAAEDRERDRILLLRVDPATRRLRAIPGRTGTGMDVYGSCMYRSASSGGFYVIVSSEHGRVRQFRLLSRSDGSVDARPVREFDVGGRTEGCVADDATGELYIGEEKRGIWRYGAEPGAAGEGTLIDRTGRNGHLTADVEGLALVDPGGGERYLIASSQGDNSYTVYRRGEVDRYVTTFRIVSGARADGVRDTDGIEATALPLGREFPAGVLVAQDGRNGGGNQNFKLVRWDLAALLAAAGG